MGYKILVEGNTYNLEQKVNKLILEGWVPKGGICVYQTSGNCYQAMIKK